MSPAPSRLLKVLAFFVVLVSSLSGAMALGLADPIVFTGEKVVLEGMDLDGEMEAEVQLLKADGWHAASNPVLHFSGEKARYQPLEEGIYVVRVEGLEARFLALDPPAALDAEAVRAALPLSSQKLLDGEEFTILAMGDSVTATGPYPEILRRLLERATGNSKIRVVVHANPGRSVDASLRKWRFQGPQSEPDLGLILYGLNDQIAGVPLPAYVEQLQYLVERLRELDADAVLLEPTPHINILEPSGPNNEIPAPSAIFRTIGYAGAVNLLAEKLKIPVAPTFGAIWGEGADNLLDAARQLWPLFPVHHARNFSTLLETEGKGDTIHPNALGHLAMARAVFDAINGVVEKPELEFVGSTSWKDGGLVSSVTVRNETEHALEGRLGIYPLPQSEEQVESEYALAPGASMEIEVPWPDVSHARDLLASPHARVFDEPGPFVQVVDFREEKSRVTAVRVPLTPEFHWVRERRVAEDRETFARLLVEGNEEEVTVTIPEGGEVGRIPLEREAEIDGRKLTAAAELVYVRYASAADGKALVDGDLAEWEGAEWIPVGEPVQARWTSGAQDHRKTPEEAYLHWAFTAGDAGLSVAFRGTGDLEGDRFTLLFDPRAPEELGKVGPYYWIDGKLEPDGKISLRAGDSSPTGLKFEGFWKQTSNGAQGEIFLPYGLMNTKEWPASGDLGLSIVWYHRHPDEAITRLMWSENGHPWNPRWFGVVRRNAGADRPYMIRIQ